MRTINIYLRVTEHTTTEVTAQNRPKSQRSYIIRNQPVTLRIGIFRHEAAVAIMSKAELEAEGWKTWLLNISKNHSMMFPVYIQPDYDYEVKPITVSEEGVISVVLNTTDTEESAKAIKGMPGDMWEAELTGFAEDDAALEKPLAVLQWPIGYVNRVADENADAPGLLESTYYTKEQVNELLRQIAPEGTWGHIIGDITDQEDLIALLEEKADKATTLAGYGITDAYTKTEVDAKVSSVFHYKGSVNSYADLPVSGMEIGDVYNVVNANEEHGIKAGDNVAWNGEKWDVLAGEIDLSDYIQKAEKGAPNGIAELDENGKVPMSQMPVLQLDSPPTTSTVGSVGQLAVYHDSATNKDHVYHLVFISTSDSATIYHWEECVLESARNVAGGFAGLDENGLIQRDRLPIAQQLVLGAIKTNAAFGSGIVSQDGVSTGELYIVRANQNQINAKTNVYNPIVPSTLDYAVRSVLPNITEIPAATSDYSLVDSSATTNNHSHVYSHSPTVVPTYRLPQVTNTAISHYIELTVDFTAVQTYSFLDYQGEPIVPLFTPAIAAGDVYTFKMEYSAIKAKWLIYPQKQGAVADDFVMRGEVGAANGVAGLDSNAVVPINQLPTATNSTKGIVNAHAAGFYGIKISSGMLLVDKASNAEINVRAQGYKPIVPNSLDYAVTAALTDSNKISLNDTQKAAAQEVFGIGGPITEIPAATSEYTLSEGIFKHAPTNAPTYNLPSITDTIRLHVIVLAIDFSSVQTFSFVPPQDSGVTFQSYANPNLGDVWVFRCVWYGGKWRIAPMKIKNCVTRQLTSGALAITDAVAGDALALKMTAPRSVVMNQLFDSSIYSTDSSYYNCSIVFNTLTGQITVTSNGITATAQFKAFVESSIATRFVIGHKYIFKSLAGIRCTVQPSDNTNITDSTGAGTVFTADGDNLTQLYINASPVGAVYDVSGYPMLVDLTQYFNGDSTLIDSITSWDDLVAYDPRFAQYVEYNAGTVTGVTPTVKVTGKNLFPFGTISITASSGMSDSKAIALPPGTYTLSSLITTTDTDSSTYSAFTVSYDDNTYDLYLMTRNSRVSKTFTTTKNVIAMRFYCGNNAVHSQGDTSTWSDVQLEIGNTATSYEPYHDGGTAQAQSELFSVGNAADEYEAVSGVTTHKMASYTFTGHENFTVAPNRENTFYMNNFNGVLQSLNSGPYMFMCVGYSSGYVSFSMTTNTIDVNVKGHSTQNQIWIYDTDCSTVEQLKAKIAGKILYYALAAPTTSQSTPTQISLQAGDNVAMQTDGGRLAPIDITYESNEI